MFCRCRATVCSLMTSAAAISRLLFPSRRGAAPRALAETSRWARVPAMFRGARDRAQPPACGRCPARPRAPAQLLPCRRARSTPARRERVCARLRRARRVEPDLLRLAQAGKRGVRIAGCERDSAARVREHRPEHRTLVTCGELLELATRLPRLLESPAASAISTYAGRSATRFSGSPISAHARRIVASAASPFPCASRSCASPGCGSQPARLASRYAASAAANSPRSRRSSACR